MAGLAGPHYRRLIEGSLGTGFSGKGFEGGRRDPDVGFWGRALRLGLGLGL